MEDLENGLSERGLIDFVKTVLLSGDNPRGKEAHKNLEWGIKQYRKQLILHGVSNRRELLLAYHRYLTEELSLDLHEIWVDEHLKANNCG